MPDILGTWWHPSAQPFPAYEALLSPKTPREYGKDTEEAW